MNLIRLACTIPLLSLFCETALATVEFIEPTPAAVLKGGQAVEVKWKSSASEFLNLHYNLFLCAGGNDAESSERLTSLTDDHVFKGASSASVYIDPTLGGSQQNAYFLQLAVDASNGTVVFHSHRFTLTDMTGSFSQRIVFGLKSISDSSAPPTRNELEKRQAGVPYDEQTGATRYAPAPKPPPSKISLKSAKPLFPTSAFKIAKSYLPTPTVQTTISKSVEPTVTPIENTAAAAVHEDDDMAKFLKRWKD